MKRLESRHESCEASSWRSLGANVWGRFRHACQQTLQRACDTRRDQLEVDGWPVAKLCSHLGFGKLTFCGADRSARTLVQQVTTLARASSSSPTGRASRSCRRNCHRSGAGAPTEGAGAGAEGAAVAGAGVRSTGSGVTGAGGGCLERAQLARKRMARLPPNGSSPPAAEHMPDSKPATERIVASRLSRATKRVVIVGVATTSEEVVERLTEGFG